MKNEIFQRLKGGLIVSCQALQGEPLCKPGFMACMATAAKEAGAVGIRANGLEDIREIKQVVNLPIIGLLKQTYPDSDVYITPTLNDVRRLSEVGVEIIAMDATQRLRPGKQPLAEFMKAVRQEFPEQLFMADCATVEDGLFAQSLGFDVVGTTMSGYTEETKHLHLGN